MSSTWDEQGTRGPPRRSFRITDRGHEVLELWVEELEGPKSRMERFLRADDGHMKTCTGDHA